MTKLPKTAKEWELYAGKSGAEAGARKLTTAVKRAVKTAVNQVLEGKSAAEAAAEAFRDIRRVQHELQDWGATDTEPEYHVTRCMRALRKALNTLEALE